MRRAALGVAMCTALGLSLTGLAGGAGAAPQDETPRTTLSVAPSAKRPDTGRKPTYSSDSERNRPSAAERARLAAEARAAAAEPQASAVAQAQVASARASVSTCRNSPLSMNQFGWVIDHFTYCNVNSWVLIQTTCVNDRCRTEEATFRMTTLGRSVPKTRRMEFAVYTDQWIYPITFATNPMSIGLECAPYAGARCTHRAPAGPGTVTKTLRQWQADGARPTRWVFNSPTRGAAGIDKIASYGVNVSITHGKRQYDYLNDFRCDSATYLANKKGCVFPRVYSSWSGLSVSDPGVNEVAKHIRAAQKKIGVGSLASGVPLTYLKVAQDTFGRIAANRAATKKACKKLKKIAGHDCDEYAFASTAEGAAAGPFSVRMVSASDNRSAGGRLRGWLSRNRMLHNDRYFVIIRR